MDSVILRKFIDQRSVETIDKYLLLLEKTDYKDSGTIRLTEIQFDVLEAKENVVYNMHIKLDGKVAHHRSFTVRFVSSYK